jgi:hypothetical protein
MTLAHADDGVQPGVTSSESAELRELKKLAAVRSRGLHLAGGDARRCGLRAVRLLRPAKITGPGRTLPG